MKEESNLSDKTHWYYDSEGNEEDWYRDKDIKEFIRLLKEDIKNSTKIMKLQVPFIWEIIENRMGDKLS